MAISDSEILKLMKKRCRPGMTPFQLREAVVADMEEEDRERTMSRWDTLLFFHSCEMGSNGRYTCKL